MVKQSTSGTRYTDTVNFNPFVTLDRSKKMAFMNVTLMLPHTRTRGCVIPTLQGAAAKVEHPLHAQPHGRQGPGGSGTLQGSANRIGRPGRQKEVCYLLRGGAV